MAERSEGQGHEMMYSMEVAAEAQRERRFAEAEHDRMVRAARVEEEPARPWRGRLALEAGRRLARVGGAA